MLNCYQYVEGDVDMNVKQETRNMIFSALFLTLAVLIQILGKNIPEINQFFVGPMVNAILLLTVYFAGLKWAILIGALTPVLAFFAGVLATPMAPFIPFIAIGNLLYSLIFALLKDVKFGEASGVLLASFVKFLFLFVSATKLINIIALGIPEPVKAKLAVAMGVPQLITALAGGFIAIALYKMLKSRLKTVF